MTERRRRTAMVLHLLRSTLPPVLAVYERQPGIGNCVVATRIAQGVLRRLGLDGRPMPCAFWAFSPAWAALVEKHGLEVTREDCPDTRALAAAGDRFVEVSPFHGPPPAGGLGYHLVLLADGLLFDGDVMQAARPERGIHLPEPMLAPVDDRFISGESPWQLRCEETGTAVAYLALPGERSFLQTPAWNRPDRSAEAIELCAQRIETLLRKAAAPLPKPLPTQS